jgi:hypothetical protein
VAEDEWVVLAQHQLFVGWVPIDAGGMDLLMYEALLKGVGIDTEFDPFRPGEGGGFTRDCYQPLRLMVRSSDIERAQALIAEVEGGTPEMLA